MNVLVDGYFDPLHVGHLEYFRRAKQVGGPYSNLVCRVAPDGDVVKRPAFQPAEDRLRIIQSLECINDAEISASLSHSLAGYQPDFLVKGKDWEGKLPDHIMTTCKRIGCQVVFTDSMYRSSTAIVGRANDVALDRMEALYRSQAEPEPWEPVTDYSHVEREKIEGKNPDLILEHLSKGPILDYGCGKDKHLSKLLIARGGNVAGYDPLLEGAHEWLTKFYDLIICREVLEHIPLRDYAQTVRDICRMSERLVYITTRFAANPTSAFTVDGRDDLDPTHITMPTKDFLRSLLVLEGFKRRADLEEVMDWQKKNRCLVYERRI